MHVTMNTKSIIAFSAVAVALALFASPLLAATEANANHISQSITGTQTTTQSSQCVSDVTSTLCGINLGGNFQFNTGNQVAGSK